MNNEQADGHTRRNLIIGLGAGAAGAAAVASPALNLNLQSSKASPASSWWDRMFLSLKNGGLDEWNSVIGQTFFIEGENGKIPAVLSSVSRLSSKGPRPMECTRTQAFALVFQVAPNRAPGGDRTYKVTHATYPALYVFLGPANKHPRRVHFEAVFN
jgi:hypothetical protein